MVFRFPHFHGERLRAIPLLRLRLLAGTRGCVEEQLAVLETRRVSDPAAMTERD